MVTKLADGARITQQILWWNRHNDGIDDGIGGVSYRNDADSDYCFAPDTSSFCSLYFLSFLHQIDEICMGTIMELSEWLSDHVTIK